MKPWSACGLFICLTMCACSTLAVFKDGENDKPILGFVNESTQTPIDVQITQAEVRDGLLIVHVLLRAQQTMKPKDIAVALYGFNDGQIIDKVVQSADTFYPAQEIDAGQEVALQLALNSQGVSEYQVHCQWGEDAIEILASTLENLGTAPIRTRLGNNPVLPDAFRELETATRNVYLKDISVSSREEQCGSQPCGLLYTVLGALRNETTQPLADIQLGLGLYWEEQGKELVLPKDLAPLTENEEVISLAKVTVPSFTERTVRVHVDRPVPVVSGGRFVPHLRILSYAPVTDTKIKSH